MEKRKIFAMPIHPEERRISGLLHELIVQSGIPLETVERHLDWEPGRLKDLLEGRLRLSFEDVLEVLPMLNTTPPDFFAWLYGFDPRETAAPAMPGLVVEDAGTGPPAQRMLDRQYEQSLKAVRDAVSRRYTWKRERTESQGS